MAARMLGLHMTYAHAVAPDRLSALAEAVRGYFSPSEASLVKPALAFLAMGGWRVFTDGMIRFADGSETKLTFAVTTPNGCTCAAGNPGPCEHEIAVRIMAVGRLPLPPVGPRRPVYLDSHATTPVDPVVEAEMRPFFGRRFGNAASDHRFGIDAHAAVATARSRVGELVGVDANAVVFTSGATEANNLAIIGVAEQYAARGRHIISAETEHKAVLDSLKHLQARGWTVTLLPVDRFGMVDPDSVAQAIRPDTVLVSIMAANNEIGTIAPLAAIGQITQRYDVLFHCDAAQAYGHIPLDLPMMGIDLLSLSGHKLYGPKGIGALIIRQRRPRIKLAPRQHGGGHERGMRSGTLDVPGIVGLGAAAQYAASHMDSDAERLRGLRDTLWHGLAAALPGIDLNGHPVERLPHNLSVRFPGLDQRALLAQLAPDLAVSIGSACSTTSVEPSHVLLAIDNNPARAFETIRFGIGRTTSVAGIDLAVEVVTEAARRMQRMRHVF